MHAGKQLLYNVHENHLYVYRQFWNQQNDNKYFHIIYLRPITRPNHTVKNTPSDNYIFILIELSTMRCKHAESYVFYFKKSITFQILLPVPSGRTIVSGAGAGKLGIPG
jgi:hypothetical protein